MRRALWRAAGGQSTAREGGQAMVEFAIVLVLLMVVTVGLIETGRGIYLYNGVSEAAREIARADSVHACDSRPCSVGTSSDTLESITRQQSLVPGLGTPTFTCMGIDGSVISSRCGSGDRVQVTTSVTFVPAFGLAGTWTLRSSSSQGIP